MALWTGFPAGTGKLVAEAAAADDDPNKIVLTCLAYSTHFERKLQPRFQLSQKVGTHHLHHNCQPQLNRTHYFNFISLPNAQPAPPSLVHQLPRRLHPLRDPARTPPPHNHLHRFRSLPNQPRLDLQTPRFHRLDHPTHSLRHLPSLRRFPAHLRLRCSRSTHAVEVMGSASFEVV